VAPGPFSDLAASATSISTTRLSSLAAWRFNSAPLTILNPPPHAVLPVRDRRSGRRFHLIFQRHPL